MPTQGTAGGVGSPQGGQVGWDEDLNTQPIPPSNEGTTSAGMTGTVYDPAQEAVMATKTKTDKERELSLSSSESTTTEDDFGLPPGVSTKASRGEVYSSVDEPQEEPLLTVEEQMAGGSAAQLEARSPAALAEAERDAAEARQRSIDASAASADAARTSSSSDTEDAEA
jgi:hypothetical protein